MRNPLIAATCVLSLAGLSTSVVAQAAPHRVILVSFDGFSERPMRMFSDSVLSQSVWSMFRTGACAEGVRPAFPSVTPTGHASIWTGAYGNVNGIAAIANGKLPLDQTTILDFVDGYRAPSLRAEPIWLSAARQGKRVFSHMATQSPGAPGYPAAVGSWPQGDWARARAETTLARPNLGVVNAYNELVAETHVITADSSVHRARDWRGLASLGAIRREAREASWPFGAEGDTLHALFFVRADGSTGALLSTRRDAAGAVRVRPAPADTSPMKGRALARYFSQPLRVDLQRGRRTFVYARLFELAPDLSRILLFTSEARVLQANRPDVAASYDDAVRGVPANGAVRTMERGGFGPTVDAGGDGTAELRYFETAELVARQFMRGTEWGWRRYSPELLIDYLPYPDEALHTWYGFAHPWAPGVSPTVRAHAAAMLHRAYGLVDLRLAQLRRLAAETPGTMLVVTGEHGMRPSWATFRPNVLLREAGLLAADSAGRIDLSHTVAAAARGNWISVNRTSRRDGIVPDDSAERGVAARRSDSSGRA